VEVNGAGDSVERRNKRVQGKHIVILMDLPLTVSDKRSIIPM